MFLLMFPWLQVHKFIFTGHGKFDDKWSLSQLDTGTLHDFLY